MFNPVIDRFEPTDIPNAPILYLEKNKNKYSGCWKLPEIMDMKFTNKHWQIMELPGTKVYLYAAYFDTRKLLMSLKLIKCENISLEFCFQSSES